FKIFKGKKTNAPQLTFNKKDNLWFDDSGKELELERVNTYLSHVYDLKSHIILDKLTEPMEKTLEKYLEAPLYTLVIDYGSNNIITYSISELVNSFEGLKIEKKQMFIVKISNRKHPYLLQKDHLSLFMKDQRSFKSLPFKKLFY